MKKVLGISFALLLIGGIIVTRPLQVQAAIEAIFEFAFTESTLDTISTGDTAIDRVTGNFYVLSTTGDVTVFNGDGQQILSFNALTIEDEGFEAIAVHPVSKDIYVTSSEQGVKIYDDEGTFIESYGADVLAAGNPSDVAVDENGSYLTSQDNQELYFFDSAHDLVATESVTGVGYVETDSGTIYVTAGSEIIPYGFSGGVVEVGTPVTISVTWSETFAVRPNGDGFGFSFNSRDGSYVALTDADGNEDATYDDMFRSIRSIEFDADGALIVANQTSDAGNIRAYDVDNLNGAIYYIPREDPGFIQNGSSIEVDEDGNVYIVDATFNQIKKYTAEGEFIEAFGEAGSGDGQFNSAVDMVLDSSGNMYVADKDNFRVQVLSPEGDYVRQWAVNESGAYEGPLWIGIINEKVYVAGRGGDDRLVQVFSLEGAPLFTFGGPDSLIDGQFDGIDLMEAGDDGKVYVFDTNQNYINIFNADGTFIEKFNEFTIDGTPEIISFDMSDIVVDEHSNIFLGNYSGYQVVILNALKEQIGVFGGNGGADGEFSEMKSIGLSDDTIYVGDSNRTQVFSYTDDVEYATGEEEQDRGSRSGSAPRKTVITPIDTTICSDGPFIQNLKIGDRSDSVKEVQEFLVKQGVYRGPATGFFGPLTRAAVIRFQVLYQQDILVPLNLKNPTGVWHAMSRAKANSILGCQ